MKKCLLRLALCALLLGGFSACSKKEKTATAAPAHHAHTAPHGGTLIEIGDHQYTLELLREASAGTLTAYLLDAHAEHFIRSSVPSFTLTATVAGEIKTLALVATPNPATGETVGDTSQFMTQADWLKTTANFDAVIAEVTVRGTKFEKIAFNFPRGNDDDAK